MIILTQHVTITSIFAKLFFLRQEQYKVQYRFSAANVDLLISYSLWLYKVVIDCCVAVIGLLYPYLDDLLGEKRGHKQEWSSVMRCIAVFVGINHASAVSFANMLHRIIPAGAGSCIYAHISIHSNLTI